MSTLACRTLNLAVDPRGRVTHVRRQDDGYDYLSAAAPAVGLWQLGLIRPARWDDPLPPIRIPDLAYQGHEWWANRNEYDADLVVDSDQAPAPTMTGDAAGRSLAWSVPIPGGSAVVALEIRGGPEADCIAFTVQVSLPSGWALKSVVCPRIRGWGDSRHATEDALLFPENWGVLRRNPLEDETQYIGQYPGAVNWCQMTAWLHGEAGVYLSLETARGAQRIPAEAREKAAAPWIARRIDLLEKTVLRNGTEQVIRQPRLPDYLPGMGS